jgi:hypothetical protein
MYYKKNLAGKFEICQISLLYIVIATDSVILDHAVVYEVQSQILMQWYSWLQKKNGNCRNKSDAFLQFFYSLKPS